MPIVESGASFIALSPFFSLIPALLVSPRLRLLPSALRSLTFVLPPLSRHHHHYHHHHYHHHYQTTTITPSLLSSSSIYRISTKIFLLVILSLFSLLLSFLPIFFDRSYYVDIYISTTSLDRFSSRSTLPIFSFVYRVTIFPHHRTKIIHTRSLSKSRMTRMTTMRMTTKTTTMWKLCDLIAGKQQPR